MLNEYTKLYTLPIDKNEPVPPPKKKNPNSLNTPMQSSKKIIVAING